MTPDEVRVRLAVRPLVIIPAGTTEQHGPVLPLGCDTVIVERLADDLAAAVGGVCAPTVEYGVHAAGPCCPGEAALRRRTLHRMMNELIESWEVGAGAREFLILTAQAEDAHQEALSTIRADGASVLTVDVLGLDFGAMAGAPGRARAPGALETALLLHLAPGLVRREGSARDPAASDEAGAREGALFYRFMLDRLRALVAPA